MTDDREILSVREAAEFLGISERTLRDLCHAGQVPHIRWGRLIRFSRRQLLARVEEEALQTELQTKRAHMPSARRRYLPESQ